MNFVVFFSAFHIGLESHTECYVKKRRHEIYKIQKYVNQNLNKSIVISIKFYSRINFILNAFITCHIKQIKGTPSNQSTNLFFHQFYKQRRQFFLLFFSKQKKENSFNEMHLRNSSCTQSHMDVNNETQYIN